MVDEIDLEKALDIEISNVGDLVIELETLKKAVRRLDAAEQSWRRAFVGLSPSTATEAAELQRAWAGLRLLVTET